jgi:chromosomal replication initiation ATPase DnaA
MTAARQLVLDLPARPALGRADFFVAPANAVALGLVERWPNWPERRLALSGPAGAGKSHLAQVWATRAGARPLSAGALGELDVAELAPDAALVIEDGDRIALLPHPVAAEEALFHLCNRLALGGGSLLLTGREPPARWALRLPDLASRLGATAVARLDPPDDALLAAVLVKLFADRQLEVSPDLIGFLLGRIERAFAAAEAIVARLDRDGLARRRRITPRLAAEVLRESVGDAR